MPLAGLFITGTDTDVGKTYITAMIARELRDQSVNVGAYKPACSGADVSRGDGPVWQDVEILHEATGRKFARNRICPQCFIAASAPPTAARSEGRTVDSDLMRTGIDWWRQESGADLLLVEGVGGLLSPLTETESVADLAADFGFPLLIVARLGLGTINHTLLTVEAAVSRGFQIAGIVLNEEKPGHGDVSANSNPDEIAARCQVPVLGVVPYNGTGGLLRDGCPIKIHWQTLMRI